MFRLLRWLVSLALLVAFGWFAFAVPLGKKTLWEHGWAIAKSRESQELADGVKQRVLGKSTEERSASKSKTARQPDAGAGAVKPPHADSEALTGKEREVLRRLIRDKLTRADTPQK